MTLLLAALLVAAFAQSAGQLASQASEIVLDFRHGKRDVLLINVEVNGRPAVLLLDTAAQMTVVAPELLGLSNEGLSASFSSRGPGYRGDAVIERTTVRLGAAAWREHPVAVMNLDEVRRVYETQIDGLLGEDLLCKFKRITVDYRSKQITLAR